VGLPERRAEVLLATTWACNLRCTYCFVRENEIAGRSPAMSPETASRVVDALDCRLSHFGEVNLHFYGGEALTNLPAMESVVARAGAFPSGRFSLSITTNGTLLDPRVFELLGAGNFDVTLSIDGPAAVHDACRRTREGAPTHALVMEFLRNLREKTNCTVKGSAVVHGGWRLSEATAYLRGLGVDAIKAQAIRAPAGASFALTPQGIEAYLGDLETIGAQVREEIAAGGPVRDGRFIGRILGLLLHVRREAFCGAGRSFFGVMPSGDVLPCLLLDADEHRLGSLLDPESAWVEAGLDWYAARRRPRPECHDCPAIDLCGGGCPAMLAVCADDQCAYTRKEIEIARAIYAHFESEPVSGLDPVIALTGISAD
jgi:uncharacterized protein